MNQDGIDHETDASFEAAEGRAEAREIVQAFDWLLTQFRGSDLWMDGTMHWSLPLRILTNIRSRSALDAVLTSYRKSLSTNNLPSLTPVEK